jgi:para-nitrobenzyl esterase
MRLLFPLIALLSVQACTNDPSVLAGGETLVGKREGDVFAFLGVPFAEPPLGELRWRAPRPYVARYQPREATAFAPACMQTMRILDWYRYLAETFGGTRDYYPDLETSEDCLYLNVWTPALDDSATLPVMVWLHGGSNISGWSWEKNYHGSELADEGVVVVSIGYRVGLFGFMSHPDMDASEPIANFGLWDIIAGLGWVQENIASFGGDPDRVTLFGESAGGHNIVALMTAEPARGLLRGAILQSAGGILSDLQPLGETQRLGSDLATAMGFDGKDQLTKLRAVPADELLQRYVADVSSGYQNPTLDGRLLRQSPWKTFAAGEFGDIRLIAGTNADEWWDYIAPDVDIEDARRRADLLSHIESAAALDAIADEPDPRRAIDRLRTADEYLCPAQWLAAAMSAAGKNAWMFQFTRIRQDEGGSRLLAYHGAEYPYVFDTHDPYMTTTATDRELTRIMQTYWTNFAATGDPNEATVPAWTRFAAPEFSVQELGDTVRTIAAPEPTLCASFDRAADE